jgi:hypothetical protein
MSIESIDDRSENEKQQLHNKFCFDDDDDDGELLDSIPVVNNDEGKISILIFFYVYFLESEPLKRPRQVVEEEKDKLIQLEIKKQRLSRKKRGSSTGSSSFSGDSQADIFTSALGDFGNKMIKAAESINFFLKLIFFF